ncbi:MAG: 5'/3'-nucleotidase SurE [Ardenticatenaceae bacterium]|nr:5'/3'-nucleotidase SurE [Ardenticatenaceae bacterium]MCB8989479.1 5'/3'-nucleotidase SurE [Ardenticatenaceae bacterium]
MHILVTNDDGITAPGLLALVQAMRQVGEVSVIAPDHDWSGGGHVKTLKRPLRVRQVKLADGTAALTSDGAPSDCVALGVMGLLPKKVDLIVSGINPMANLGQDVTYSGTVTAAMEGIIWHIPSIAVSLDAGRSDLGDIDYDMAARVARFVVRTLTQIQLPKGIFLNVNVPYIPVDHLKGIRLTRQGQRVYRDRLDKRQDPRGNDYYWIGGDVPTGVPETGTDVGALAQGYVSITPLQLDLTAYSTLSSMAVWGWAQEDMLPVNGIADALSLSQIVAGLETAVTP